MEPKLIPQEDYELMARNMVERFSPSREPEATEEHR